LVPVYSFSSHARASCSHSRARGSTRSLYEFKDDTAELYRRLAYDLQRFWDCNDRRFQAIFTAFRLAVVGLVVEIGALGVLATGTL
jgi:hypothetical protein